MKKLLGLVLLFGFMCVTLGGCAGSANPLGEWCGPGKKAEPVVVAKETPPPPPPVYQPPPPLKKSRN